MLRDQKPASCHWGGNRSSLLGVAGSCGRDMQRPGISKDRKATFLQTLKLIILQSKNWGIFKTLLMFYMPCEKVNICKKSWRAGAEFGGALSNLPCHGLAGSLVAGMNRLCLHQVGALFGVCSSCGECSDNDARNKHGVCCLCYLLAMNPSSGIMTGPSLPSRNKTLLRKGCFLMHDLSCWRLSVGEMVEYIAFRILFDLYY